MKTIATLLLIIICQSLAQAQCYKKVQDKFTNEVSWELNQLIRLDNFTKLVVYAGGPKIFKTRFKLLFVCDDIITVDENSYCTFLFTDGTKQTIKNTAGYNLDGTFAISEYDYKLGGGAKMLAELLTKKISAIRLSGYSDSKDIDLLGTESDSLQQKLNCLYAGWKAERK